jgi:hypothetical protein
MTMQELTVQAAAKGIQITRKGYKMYGTYHRIADWPALLREIAHHDPVQSQVAGWLRDAARRA